MLLRLADRSGQEGPVDEDDTAGPPLLPTVRGETLVVTFKKLRYMNSFG